MIRLNNITKYYPSKLGNQYIFKDLTFEIPTKRNIAILGKNGAGKSTLFRLIAASEYPEQGNIVSEVSISWPVALATGIHPEMTGKENTRFIGRVNGVKDLKRYERKVELFSELGQKFNLPVKSYSSGMRSRLTFACCMSIDFDVYLIDEVTSVGDTKFKHKAKQTLASKKDIANVIMVSHDMLEVREFCDSAIILNNGTLSFYDDLEEAIRVYQDL